MLIAWMSYATLFALLMACGALAGERVARVWRRPERWLWVAALIAAIAAPAFLAARDPAPPLAPVASASAVAPSMARAQRVSPRFIDRLARIASALDPFAREAWFAASATLVLVFVIAHVRLRRRSSSWSERELDGVPVLLAADAGPAVVGALRPRIVVPPWALSLDRRQRELMLRHELEHIRAHDPRWHLVAAVSLVLFPWNAALWFVVRRLRLAIELDCDRRVLRASGDAHEYGALLLAVGSRQSISFPLATALLERRSLLERRIRAMTSATPRHPILVSLAAVAGIGLVSLAASAAPRPGALRASAREGVSASQDSMPKISVSYQDAPIEKVIAAFAQFTRRNISLSKDVTGTVTAVITKKPWDVALKEIMAKSGYKVVFNADGSISISK